MWWGNQGILSVDSLWSVWEIGTMTLANAPPENDGGFRWRRREIQYIICRPVVLFNFPVKQEKRCINPPLRAGDKVRVRVRVTLGLVRV